MPFIYSPMLLILAILIIAKMFKNYNTIEKLFNIIPLKGEILYLQWKKNILNITFFGGVFAKQK